jgi:hypothetical protein
MAINEMIIVAWSNIPPPLSNLFDLIIPAVKMDYTDVITPLCENVPLRFPALTVFSLGF